MERKWTSSTHWRESSVHSKAESSRSSDFRTEYTFKNVNFRSTIDTPTKSFQRDRVCQRKRKTKTEEEQTRTKPRKFKNQKHLMWDEKIKTQIKTHTSSIAKTTLKPRTRPPQFLNHSPFGWSWTHMSPPAMPWQQPISTSLSNPDQTDSASLFLAHIKPIKPRSKDLREINFELREKKFDLKVWPCGVKIEKNLISLWCFGVMWGVLFWISFRLILCWSGFIYLLFFFEITDGCFWVLNFLGSCCYCSLSS